MTRIREEEEVKMAQPDRLYTTSYQSATM